MITIKNYGTKILAIFCFLIIVFFHSLSFSQNKPKVKGSKNVTKEFTTLKNLVDLETEDNLIIDLIKGSENKIEIETDDNLHEFITVESFGNKVRLYTSKNITQYKELKITVFYTDSLKTITAKHESAIQAFQELNTESIVITNQDFSKSFLNIKAKKVKLIAGDKSKVEANIKAPEIYIQSKQNSQIKTLVKAEKLELSVLDKSKLMIEGDVKNSNIRVAGNGELIAKNLINTETFLIAENHANVSVFASDIFGLKAKNNAEIHLYGAPKIFIEEFLNKTILHKEEK